MSASEGWAFTAGDHCTGVHGDRFAIEVAATTTPRGRTTNPSAERFDSAALSLQTIMGAVISTFLADALPRSAA